MTESSGNTATSQDVVKTQPQFKTEDYRNMTSFDEAAALVLASYGVISTAADELGDGFALLKKEDKNRLVDVPLLFVAWEFYPSDQGSKGEFVSAHVITKDNLKFIINDGSTGIYEQLRDFTDTRNVKGGLLAAHGLRKSEYPYTDDDGKEKSATTYYINTAA